MPQGGRVPLQVLEEDEEQVTFTWGGRTYPVADPRNFPLALADAVLGAGATSRLFQEVREKRGLAYDISSYTVGFKETGLLAIDGAASPATFPQVLELVVREVQRLRADGLTRDELCRAREQLKVGMALALETTNDRMRRLVQHLFTWGEIRPLGYIIRELEAVTLDDTQAAIEEVINPATWSFAAIGPVDEGQVRAALGY
jgi:predicted Zn-dependent peptidase